MFALRLVPSIIALLCLFEIPLLAGQQVPEDEQRRPIRLVVGAALGLGPFPGAFDPQCGTGFQGRTTAGAADVRVGILIGRFRFETRTSSQTEMVYEDCLFVGPGFNEGVHTYRTTPLRRGPLKSTDLRAGYVLAHGLFYWDVNAGGAWAWSADLPAFVIGSGIGAGSRFRLGLNVDWSTYRIPWHVVTAEWRAGQLVQEFRRVETHDWRSGYSVRLNLEYSRSLKR